MFEGTTELGHFARVIHEEVLVEAFSSDPMSVHHATQHPRVGPAGEVLQDPKVGN
jgi:hypothetical protein